VPLPRPGADLTPSHRVIPLSCTPDITPSYRDPPILYTLSPLTKGGKGWVRGGFHTARLCILCVRENHGHNKLVLKEF